MRILFWASLAVLAYTYAGYPLLTIVAAGLMRRKVRSGPSEPTVSIIIAAYNEAAHLRATLQNKLHLDYPREKLQIIVVSDASTDGTDDIAREHVRARVVFIRQDRRRGKTAALNAAVRHATGEVLVFSDANSVYGRDAIRTLVRNFDDPQVGYVTGRMVYGMSGRTNVGIGCRCYMAYEDLLRRSETNVGSIVGVNGGIDAMRRSLYEPMRDDQLPDFVLPLDVVRKGFRVVYDSSAVLHEQALTTGREEYRMRVRVALRAWWTLYEMRDLLNPVRHGIFAFQLASHKVLRYLTFAAVPLLYLSALGSAPAGLVYQVAFGLMSAFLLFAGAGAIIERGGRSMWPCSVPFYFLLVNVAAAHALVDFLRGRRRTVWTPRLG